MIRALSALAGELPEASGYLIDLDGTLWSGSNFLPGALNFLAGLNRPFVIVSNDAEHVPDQISHAFATAGFAVDPSRIVLAGAVAVEQVALRSPGARVMVLGSDPLIDLARARMLVFESARPEIVVLARDRTFSFDKLAMAANAILEGARLVVACPDTTHPGRDGRVVPEVGALAAAILACVGNIAYETVGKPESTLFSIGCERLGIAPEECLMIGDNPATDGLGAARAGIAFCQVAVMGERAALASEAHGAMEGADGAQTNRSAIDVGGP